MYILGISCFYHDSSACLLKDGKIVAAALEERFSRRKHDSSFPLRAARYCLDEAGIKIEEVEHVAYYEKPILKFERILNQHLEMFPRSFLPFYLALPSWFNEKLRLRRVLRKQLGYRKNVLYIQHHLAHAASAFLVSPFEEAAILTVDGVGEWQTTVLSVGHGSNIKQLYEINFPHSLGLLYSAITAFLGFKVNNDEYKVMGLAAYGKPLYVNELRKLIDIKADGSFALRMEYFAFHHRMHMLSNTFFREFGLPRSPNDPITDKHKDIACSLQTLLEEIIMMMCVRLQAITGQKNLCIAGGVGLNSVANGKILRHTPFKDIYIQPDSGDGGGSLGAAYYAYNSVLGRPRTFTQLSAYYGPSYTREDILKFLNEHNILYRSIDDEDDFLSEVARLIRGNNIVGWFQGRMEWGPRALGARSILSDPTNPDMQDILNHKVKHREPFRPFAPVVPVRHATEYFDCDNPIPTPADFMLMVYPIRKERRAQIPAVTHVDGSGRLQTVRAEQNPRYYKLIKKFGELSGVPILINTSFNIRGEPIVLNPEDAYRCMMGTGIDYLAIDTLLIKRSDNPKDMWDSENYAKD